MSAQRQTTGGKQDVQKLKDKKGFTLVELIVVLVILAILAALLVPALTGYIDKANKEKVVSETRMVVMAAQTEASEAYGKKTSNASGATATTANDIATAMIAAKNVDDLAEVNGNFDITVDADGTISQVKYTNAGYTCIYRTKEDTTTKLDAGYNVGKVAADGAYVSVDAKKINNMDYTD